MGGAARRAVGDDEVDFVVTARAAERPLAFGLDVGSSSIRAFVYDRLGRRLGGLALPYEWTTTPGGGIEADADLLVERAARAIDGALEAVGPAARELAAVGVSAFWHGVLGVDERGDAVTPVLPWHDRRASAEAGRLRERLGERASRAGTGPVFHPNYLPARLMWLRTEHPDLFARARYWMSPGEYLAFRFFGERRVSVSMASATGLLREHALDWDSELLALLGTSPDQLSPIVDLDEAFRGLREPFAGRWPALAQVPWLPAVGDGATANVGSGCTTPDAAALSVGTSAAIRVVAPVGERRAPAPVGLWRYRLDRRRAVIGGAVANGGIVYAWLRRTLDVPPEPELERRLDAGEPDAHGLTVLPYLLGERGPDWPLESTAAIVGFRADTTPIDVVRAALEAVAYRLAFIRGRMRDTFPAIETVVAGGGALARSPAWTRILADVLGEPLAPALVPETSARGAALLALEAVGALDDAGDAPAPWGEPIRPDPARHERYRAGIERFRALDERLADGLRSG